MQLTLQKKYAMEKKCMVFTIDIETCDKIAKEVSDSNINAFAVHSELAPRYFSRKILTSLKLKKRETYFEEDLKRNLLYKGYC